MSEVGTLTIALTYIAWDGRTKRKALETIHGLTYQTALEVAKDFRASNTQLKGVVISYQPFKNYI